jgi:acyl dehydratase
MPTTDTSVLATTISLEDLVAQVGTEIGLSDWITVDQPMIDRFAEATNDHQFIHVDPERAAAEGPFGGTIAHGFLTVSLLSAMNYDCIPTIEDQQLSVNYGFEKLRFMAPVKAGKRIRGRFVLSEARRRGQQMMMLRYQVTVEIEGETKPALSADWLTLIQMDPAALDALE